MKARLPYRIPTWHARPPAHARLPTLIRTHGHARTHTQDAQLRLLAKEAEARALRDQLAAHLPAHRAGAVLAAAAAAGAAAAQPWLVPALGREAGLGLGREAGLGVGREAVGGLRGHGGGEGQAGRGARQQQAPAGGGGGPSRLALVRPPLLAVQVGVAVRVRACAVKGRRGKSLS